MEAKAKTKQKQRKDTIPEKWKKMAHIDIKDIYM